jgi:hypothetical protein
MLEALLLRAPFVADRLTAWVARMPPGSPMRRRLLTFALRRAFDAHTRKDIEVTLLGYEPDVEIELHGAEGLGLKRHYSGHAGWYEFIGELYETFEDPRYSTSRLVDAGDRLVFQFEVMVRGRASSVETTLVAGNVAYMSERGRVRRQEVFWQAGWERALEAAGLDDVDPGSG